MQIRQVPVNPHPGQNIGLRNVRRDIIREDHGPIHRQQVQRQRRPINLSEMSFQNKKILIRRQLLLMLHARMCTCEDLIYQRENPNTPRPRCEMPHCALLKTVLNHMKGCTLGRDCTVVHCSSSRQILSHWKNCANNACPVCPARLKPTNYGIPPVITNATANNNIVPTPTTTNAPVNNGNNASNTITTAAGQGIVPPSPIPAATQVASPIFARNLNRFKSILHAEISILSATFEAVESGESPTVSPTTGEIVPVEE